MNRLTKQNRIQWLVLSVLASTVVMASHCVAQPGFNRALQVYDRLENRRRDQRNFDLSAALQSEQASYRRVLTQSVAMVRFAESRERLATAYAILQEGIDRSLDNYRKRVEVYYDSLEEIQRGRMRMKDLAVLQKDQYVDHRKLELRRMWESMKSAPQLHGKSLCKGRTLNFMLDRFAGTPIGYGIPLDEYYEVNGKHSRWDLDPSMHHAIRVNGENGTFRLDQTVALNVDWWPGVLSGAAIAPYAEQMQDLREKMADAEASHGRVPPAMFDEMKDLLAALSQKFYETYPREQWRIYPSVDIIQLHKAEMFLTNLNRDISRMSESGSVSAVGSGRQFSPEIHGRDAASLVSWMTNNGLKFADANPGDCAAYNRLFNSFMELYIAFGEPIAGEELVMTERAKPRPNVIEEENGNVIEEE